MQLVIQFPRSITEVARYLEINPATLGNWTSKHRQDSSEPEPGLSPDNYGRLAALEEQNRTLKMENEFLKESSSTP